MTTPIIVHFIQVDLYSGDKKKHSQSESREDHIRGGQIQQKSLGGTAGCSV